MKNLERVGIILNFFAGFLLAPELIGLDNLMRFEYYLERIITRLNQKVVNIINQIKTIISRFIQVFRKFGGATTFLVLILLFPPSTGVLYLIFQLFIKAPVVVRYVTLAYLLITFIVILFFSITIAKELPFHPTYYELPFQDLPRNLDYILNGMAFALMLASFLVIPIPFVLLIILFLISLTSLSILILVVFGMLFVLILIIMMLPAVSMRLILSFVLRMLVGEERLQTIIKSLGVFLFILGNALDFTSTF